jgi:hypothetical protein
VSGQADYYAPGLWNFRCQECYKKMKSSQARKRWDGLWVGPECLEPRNPQDFVRGIPDDPSVPWSTGDPPPLFVPSGGLTPSTAGKIMLGAWLLGSKPLG